MSDHHSDVHADISDTDEPCCWLSWVLMALVTHRTKSDWKSYSLLRNEIITIEYTPYEDDLCLLLLI